MLLDRNIRGKWVVRTKTVRTHQLIKTTSLQQNGGDACQIVPPGVAGDKGMWVLVERGDRFVYRCGYEQK